MRPLHSGRVLPRAAVIAGDSPLPHSAPHRRACRSRASGIRPRPERAPGAGSSL